MEVCSKYYPSVGGPSCCVFCRNVPERGGGCGDGGAGLDQTLAPLPLL